MDDVVRFLIVDDDRSFASLFEKLIVGDGRLLYLGNATDRLSGIEMSRRLSPQVVVMDLNLSGDALDGIEAAKEIRVQTGAKVLLLTAYEEQETIINASKKAFASGYIFKSQFHSIADTIYETATSNTPQKELIRELAISELSSAEKAVLKDLVLGNSSLPYSSPSTLANQKTSIFRKLGLKNTKELLNVFQHW